MSFFDCIDTALSAGEVSQANADALKKRYARFHAQYKDMGNMADAEAKKALEEMLRAEAAHQRKKAKLAVQAIKRINYDLVNFRNAKGENDIAAGAEAMLEHYGTEARFSSVVGRQKAITGMAHARMESLLHEFRRHWLKGDKARWNRARLDNVVKELFGEDSGDVAAKGLAGVWTKVAEDLRQRFNRAGGAIGKIETWGLPQHHDARALLKTGMSKWKEDIRPLLDVSRMKNPLTGRKIDEAEIDSILTDLWKSIVTDGWNKRDVTAQSFGKGALANQRAEHRFLIFKDAESWLDYQRNYGGGGDAFAAMMGHINMMAKDIAALEILGPNPDATITWMKNAIQKQASLKLAGDRSFLAGRPGRAIDRANSSMKRIDALWGSIRGELETPVNGRWASTFGTVRSLVTASTMGGAALSSLSDVGTSMLTRQFAGIKGGKPIVDTMAAMRGATKRQAIAAGLINDSALHVFHAQARYIGTLDGPAWASFLADRVLTLSGLTPWTQAGKHAFGLAFMQTAAEHAGKNFADLPDALRNTFRRHGFKPDEWERMRAIPMHDMGDGVMMLRPQEIDERIGNELAEKYLAMIQTETLHAIPEATHRSKIFLLDQNQPGTFLGEVLRSFAMFKSFGVVLPYLHGMRVYQMIAAGDRAKGAAYAGALLFSTMFFGGLSIQLKQMAAGRDPRDMRSEEVWGAALLQGGGLGLYGDFLFSNVNRFGGGFSTTFGGPVMARANDLWNLTAGNLIQLASGEKTHFGREAIRFAKGNIPGSNIWYIKLAWERIVMDQAQFLADPEANRAFKRQQQYWNKNYGQDFWWKPGETAPQRGPDWGAAFGSS